MGGATSKLDVTEWDKAYGKLLSSEHTIDGAPPTTEYAIFYMTKRGVNQREFDITDADSNLIYTTRQVPGTIACFDLLGRDLNDHLIRVNVDLARRYWTILRYEIPTFEEQKPDKAATQKVAAERLAAFEANPTPDTFNTPCLFKKGCITVSWSRYMAVASLYGPPTEEMVEAWERYEESVRLMKEGCVEESLESEEIAVNEPAQTQKVSDDAAISTTSSENPFGESAQTEKESNAAESDTQTNGGAGDDQNVSESTVEVVAEQENGTTSPAVGELRQASNDNTAAVESSNIAAQAEGEPTNEDTTTITDDTNKIFGESDAKIEGAQSTEESNAAMESEGKVDCPTSDHNNESKESERTQSEVAGPIKAEGESDSAELGGEAVPEEKSEEDEEQWDPDVPKWLRQKPAPSKEIEESKEEKKDSTATSMRAWLRQRSTQQNDNESENNSLSFWQRQQQYWQKTKSSDEADSAIRPSQSASEIDDHNLSETDSNSGSRQRLGSSTDADFTSTSASERAKERLRGSQKAIKSWFKKQSESFNKSSYFNKPKIDPMEGVIHLDKPLLLCQEIYTRIIGNHQTSLISKERVIELLKQDVAQHAQEFPETATQDEEDSPVMTGQDEVSEPSESNGSPPNDAVEVKGTPLEDNQAINGTISSEKGEGHSEEGSPKQESLDDGKLGGESSGDKHVMNGARGKAKGDERQENIDGGSMKAEEVDSSKKDGETIKGNDGEEKSSSTGDKLMDEPIENEAQTTLSEQNEANADLDVEESDGKEDKSDGKEDNVEGEEGKDGEEEDKEQPIVGYWLWENTFRIHKMKMHVAKGTDLALHVVLAIITNQVRYERNALAMTTGL